MFHWICPECGREIPPAVKECPVCDPHSAPALPPPLPVLSSSANGDHGAAGGDHTAQPARVPATLGDSGGNRTENSRSAEARSLEGSPDEVLSSVATATAPEELPSLKTAASETASSDAAEPEPPQQPLVALPSAPAPAPGPAQPPIAVGPTPLPASERPYLENLATAGEAGAVTAPSIALSGTQPVPRPVGSPLSPPSAETRLATAAGPLPASELARPILMLASGQQQELFPLPAVESAPTEESAPAPEAPPLPSAEVPSTSSLATSSPVTSGPVASAQPPPLPVNEQATAPAAGESIVPMAPLGALPPPRLAEYSQRPAGSTAGPLAASGLPVFVPAAGRVSDPSLRYAGDAVLAEAFRMAPKPGLQAPAVGNGATAIPLHANNPIQPSLRPAAGPSAAGLIDYSASARQAIRPARLGGEGSAAPPQPRFTLPGPALPRELNSLADAGLRTVLASPRPPRRVPVSRLRTFLWIAVAAGLLAGLAILYVQPSLMLSAKPAAEPSEPAPAEAASASAVITSNPLSKSIEVTGFRFIVDLNTKSEIHYLVVNHSPIRFGGVTVYVTLRSSDSRPGQPPVARFSFRAPDLGPYAAREMTSPIEKISRPVNLPDWQDMHADIEIAE